MKVTVVGTGYVGMSMCALLAPICSVVALDTDIVKVNAINNRKSTVKDLDIENALENPNLDLIATLDKTEAYAGANYVIVATPTNYDEMLHQFDVTSVKTVISDVNTINPQAVIVIKSTIPVGFIQEQCIDQGISNVIFSPEFLREGVALKDNYYPSRIIVGEVSKRAKQFAHLLKQACKKPEVPVLLTEPTEAEAIKLFSNNYLAMRVAFFNELDTYAEHIGINAKQVIEGVGLDPRIGMHYHNPSFGYGGYCLPKDTKQLKANMVGTNCQIIPAVVAANHARKEHIVKRIISKKPKVVGVYKLAMKTGSDNHRSSAVIDIIEQLEKNDIKVIVYDPCLQEIEAEVFDVVFDLVEFVEASDLIIANRVESEIQFTKDKVYTRDIYHLD